MTRAVLETCVSEVGAEQRAPIKFKKLQNLKDLIERINRVLLLFLNLFVASIFAEDYNILIISTMRSVPIPFEHRMMFICFQYRSEKKSSISVAVCTNVATG